LAWAQEAGTSSFSSSPSLNSISHLPARAPQAQAPAINTYQAPAQPRKPRSLPRPPRPRPRPRSNHLSVLRQTNKATQPQPLRSTPRPRLPHLTNFISSPSSSPPNGTGACKLPISLSLGCYILPLFTLDSTQSDVPLGKTTTITSSIPSITKHHRLSQSLPQFHVLLIRPSKQSHWLDISGEPQLTLTHLHPYLSISSHHLVDISLSLPLRFSSLVIPISWRSARTFPLSPCQRPPATITPRLFTLNSLTDSLVYVSPARLTLN
jgi:hypothetical protein